MANAQFPPGFRYEGVQIKKQVGKVPRRVPPKLFIERTFQRSLYALWPTPHIGYWAS